MEESAISAISRHCCEDDYKHAKYSVDAIKAKELLVVDLFVIVNSHQSVSDCLSEETATTHSLTKKRAKIDPKNAYFKIH